MKIAIVVGHNETGQGAKRVTDGRSEFDWNGELAQTLARMSPVVKVFHRIYHGPRSYTAEVRECYSRVNAWGADVSLELHFNGGPASATGTETLYATNAGKALAERVHGPIVAALGLRDRGLKKLTATDNGYGALMAGRAPAVILEPYFGSNRGDCERADERFDAYAAAILSAFAAPVVQMTMEAKIADLERRVRALEGR